MNPWRVSLERVAGLVGAAAAAQLIQLAMLPLLTRWFDVPTLGAWALFTTTAATLATLATLRYEYAIVLPRSERGARRVLALCLTLTAVATLLCALGLGLWRGLAPADGLGRAWWALPFVVAAAGLGQSFTLWHNRQAAFGRIAPARLASALATATLQVLAAWGMPSVAGLVAAHAGGALVAPMMLRVRGWPWFGGRVRPLRRRWRQTLALLRRHRRFALLNTPHAFVNALQEPLAIAAVAWAAGPQAAGFFALTMRMLRAPAALVGSAVSEVLLSALAQRWRQGMPLRPLVVRAGSGLLAVAALLGLLLWLLAVPLFGFVLGPDWAPAGEYARALVPYLVAHFVAGPLTVTPIVLGRQGTALAFSVVGNALYVGVLVVALARGASMPQALAWMAWSQLAYFAVYLGWLARAVEPARAGAAHG